MHKLLEFLKSLFKWPDIEPNPLPEPIKPAQSLAWGKKVSPEFRAKVRLIAQDLGVQADHQMAIIAFESARTFSPSVKNMAGSGATGLIQFMPKTAIGLGTTVDRLAAMSAIEQLEWVHKYFLPYKGRMKTLSDMYMAVLWPAAVGKPDDYVLFDRKTRPTAYRQNAGLDTNKNGQITKFEAAAKVYQMLEEGRAKANLWVET